MLVYVAPDTRSIRALWAVIADFRRYGYTRSLIIAERGSLAGIWSAVTSTILPPWIVTRTWTVPNRMGTAAPV